MKNIPNRKYLAWKELGMTKLHLGIEISPARIPPELILH
jgi:hypothetical protein